MGDNQLSILIQAKIDEASVDTMDRQLQTLAKNLKAVKISLDLGDVKAQFAKMFQEIEKESKKQKISSGAKVSNASNQTFTGTSDEAMRKAVLHATALDDVMKSVRDTVKGLGNLTGLREEFASTDGALTKMNARVEEVDGTLKKIKNVEVFRTINQETGEFEYQIGKVKVQTKEFGHTLESLATASKGSFYTKLYESLVQFEQGGQNATKVANQLHDAIYTKDGNKRAFFQKLDTDVQEEYLKALQRARDEEAEMDKIHYQALQMNKQQDNAKMDALHKEALEINKRYDKEQERLQKEVEKLEKDHADRLKSIEQQKIKDEEALNKKRIEQRKADMLEAIRLQEEEEKAKKEAQSKQNKQDNIDFFKRTMNDSINNLLSNYNVDVTKIDALRESMKKLDADTENVSLRMKELRTDLKVIENMAKEDEKHSLIIQQKKTFYQQIESQIKKIEDAVSNVSKYDNNAYKNLIAEYNDLKRTVESGNITLKEAKSRYQELGVQLNSFKADVKNANQATSGLFGSFKQLIGAYSLYDAFELGKRAISEMVSEVRNLDNALVELNKVTDISNSQLKAYTNTAFDISESVGRMGSEVINATSDFVKMGYSLEEASKLAENALLYVNVGDLGSVDDATSAMISTMKAFGIEAENSLQIVDKINKISNEYAIDAKGIGEGLQRASSALAVANNDINETLAMMAVGNQVVQDPVSLSDGLKTISMRIRGIAEDGSKLESKMEDVFAKYANGVKILNDDGSFRSTFNILNDLGKEWDKLSDKTKALLGEKIAGKNRANIFFALMENAKDLDGALEASKDSVNSAIQENERYMDSIDGKISQLKSAWQSFATTSIDSGLVKDVLSLTTGILKLTDACGGLVPVLVSIGVGFAVFKFAPIVAGIGKMVTAINTFSLVANGATVSVTALNTALSLGIFGAITVAIMGLGYALNYASKESERLAESISSTQDRITEIKSEIESLQSISSKTDSQEQRLQDLNEELLIREKILKTQKEQQAQDEAGNATIGRDGELAKSAYASPYNKGELGTLSESILEYQELQKEIDKLEEKQSGLSENDEAYLKIQDKINNKLNEARELRLTLSTTLGALKDKYDVLTDSQKEQYSILEKLANISIEDIDKKTGDFDVSDIVNKNRDALKNILSIQNSAKKSTIDYKEEAKKLGITVTELEMALKELKKEEESISKVKNPLEDVQIDDLAEKFSNVGSSADILQTALEELNQTNTITQETVDALVKKYPELADKITDVSSAYQALNQKISENKFDDMTQKIGDLTSILEDLQAGNGITASSFKKISSTFPELLAYMNDEASLTDAIKQKMNELKDSQNDAYKQMLINSESYYRENVKGNEQMTNSISKGITSLFNNLKIAYQGDMENWRSLAQGKAEVEEELINSLNKAWEEHFGTLRTQFTKMEGVSIVEAGSFDREKFAQKNFLNEWNPNDKLVLDMAEKEFYAQQEAWMAEKAKQHKAMRDIAKIFDDIKFDPIDIKVGGSKASSTKKSGSSKKASYVASIYQEIVDEILKGGEDIEKAIELSESKLKSAELIGDTKLQEKLKADLLTMQTSLRDKQASMAKELDVRIKEMAKILSDSGAFGGYDINSLGEKQIAEVLQKIDKQINSATSKGKDKEVDRLNNLKSLISDVGAVYVSTIEERRELSKIWWDEESGRIELLLEKIDDTYDKSKKKIDESNRAIELQQLLYKEGSKEHIELEKDKFKNLLIIQEEAYKALEELRKIDKNLESEKAQEYLNLWYDTEKEKREMVKSINEQISELRKEELEKQVEKLEEYQDAMEDIIDATVKMIQQEQEAKKKALKEELDGYKKIIDAKKEALGKEKDDRQDAKALEEKKKKVSEIEQKILELQFDNSAKATAEKLKLEEELQKAREELEDYQFEQSIDKQQEALDKEYEQFEENINKQIDAIDDYLDKEGQLRQDAINLISKNQKELYNKLIQWNREYGTGIDEDITKAWEIATDAMAEFNNGQLDVLDTLDLIEQKMKAINQEMDNINNNGGFDYIGSTDDFYDSPDDMNKPTQKPQGEEYQNLIDEIAPQMNRNSDAWKNASEEERKRLEAENERLAKKIGAWKGSDSRWYVTKKGYDKPVALKDLYPEYHTGGIVGGQPKLKSTEEFAKLLKGEVIVTQQQMEKFMRVTLPNITNVNTPTNGEVKIEKLFDLNVEGNLDSSVMPRLEELTKQLAPKIADILNQSIFNRGFKKPI